MKNVILLFLLTCLSILIFQNCQKEPLLESFEKNIILKVFIDDNWVNAEQPTWIFLTNEDGDILDCAEILNSGEYTFTNQIPHNNDPIHLHRVTLTGSPHNYAIFSHPYINSKIWRFKTAIPAQNEEQKVGYFKNAGDKINAVKGGISSTLGHSKFVDQGGLNNLYNKSFAASDNYAYFWSLRGNEDFFGFSL